MPMSLRMDPKDDILDTFDDDGELQRTIESADRRGEWRNGDAKFVDPKLEAIAHLLANAPHPTYAERRFAELERRAALKNAQEAARESSRPAGAPADWRQTVAKKAEEPAVPPVIETTRPPARPVLDCARTIGLALAVLALAATLQGLIGGFSLDLWLRAGAAGIAAGCGWALLRAGRFIAAGVGAAAHLAAFLSATDVGNRTELTAMCLGLFVTLLGSGAAGLMHEESQRPL